MGLRSVEQKIMEQLEKCNKVDTSKIEGEYNQVIGTVKKLESFETITAEPRLHETTYITAEGEDAVQRGSPEYLLYSVVEDGATMAEAVKRMRLLDALSDLSDKAVEEISIKGKSNGVKTGLIKIENGNLQRGREAPEDATQALLKKIAQGLPVEEEALQALRRRKLVSQKRITHYVLQKGAKFGVQEELISDITAEMLQNMDISNRLKKYNFSIVSVPSRYSGALHPLTLQKERVKKIFLQMGFTEMNAGKYVESSFWNFDALFQPQRHPSRDEQDTFFLANPATAADPPLEYLEKVKNVHTSGGYGSAGHQAPWSVEESRKNVLRTHTTAVTTRMLHSLAGKQVEGKYFSIDKVFRNESLDATHLAEFYQVEGIVFGKDLTISHLMGFIEVFLKSLGINRLKFKPAFNPYTEPSLEVFAYHEEMKRWMEVANSGVFRPEMLLPMGFPEDVRAIGWGISLERPVMIGRKINNIRDLVGHRVDLSFVRNGLSKNNAN